MCRASRHAIVERIFARRVAQISALRPVSWSAGVLCLFCSLLLADTFSDGVREIQQRSASGRHEEALQRAQVLLGSGNFDQTSDRYSQLLSLYATELFHTGRYASS